MAEPKVISVSVSTPQMVRIGNMELPTSIIKEPGQGPVYVGSDGLIGNKLAVHPEAVYAIGVEAYDYWAARFGVDRSSWEWGYWGENITFAGLFEQDLRIGDILEVGDELVLQVSGPRNPCVKLTWRLGVPASELATLVADGRMGFYLRVLHAGYVRAGDDVCVRPQYPHNMAVIDIPRLFHDQQAPSETIRAALEMPALSDYPKMFLRQRLTQSLDNEIAGKNRWKGWRDFRVSSISDEAHDVKSFVLRPVDDEPVAGFRAGQFLTFGLPTEASRQTVRQWSISDYGAEESYRISVKRVEGGASQWLHDNVEIGIVLPVRAPSGKFVLDIGSTKPIIFVSAGIGVTPLLAMLKMHLARPNGKTPPIVWIHAARDSAHHAFAEEVDALIANRADVVRRIFYSQPTPEDLEYGRCHHQGRISMASLLPFIESFPVELHGHRVDLPGQICEYYICGPEIMQRDLKSALVHWGVEESSVHTESFAPPKSRAVEMVDQAEVRFAVSGKTAIWRRDDEMSLLELAEASGVITQSSCRMGSCHACVCRISSGRIEHIVEVEGIADGQILPCSAVPASASIVIDL
ncbi:MOSC domain-containing protein [Sphingomonas sp. Root50]|nr:MOSC domain-containing protein [Sphingomonas sp. Root50]